MRIAFAGDMCFNYFDKNNIFFGEESIKSAMSEAAELFSSVDFSMVNLENIFGVREENIPIVKTGPNLISNKKYIEYINALSPTVVGLANNHTKDFGEKPMLDTINLLRENGYICIGAGENIERAYEPVILEKGGVKVSIIAICENEFGIADHSTSGTAGYNITRVSKAIFSAKENETSPIIFFHGGNEHNPFPSPGKVDLYRHFIDIGAEAVIAMHPHCPQGYETYNGKPIVYSMGNFFFNVMPNPERRNTWYYGYISELDISDGNVALNVHPYRFDENGIYFLKGNDKDVFCKYLSDISKDINDPVKISKLFDGWCLLTQSYIDTFDSYEKGMVRDCTSENAKSMRNVFRCEAHNELVMNTFCMMYEQRVDEAKEYADAIMEYRNIKL